MKRIGLFPGTFDPPSIGHLDIMKRALLICDELIIAIAEKPTKSSLFTIEEKMKMLKKIVPSKVEVTHFEGLIVDFAKQKNVQFLIRGLRAFSDFEYEFQMALANRRLSGIETVFLMADERHAQISSSLIREIAYFGGPIHEFVPAEIEPLIRQKYNSNGRL